MQRIHFIFTSQGPYRSTIVDLHCTCLFHLSTRKHHPLQLILDISIERERNTRTQWSSSTRKLTCVKLSRKRSLQRHPIKLEVTDQDQEQDPVVQGGHGYGQGDHQGGRVARPRSNGHPRPSSFLYFSPVAKQGGLGTHPSRNHTIYSPMLCPFLLPARIFSLCHGTYNSMTMKKEIVTTK